MTATEHMFQNRQFGLALRGASINDFHLCGGCGYFLFLTSKRRLRLSFFLQFPLFFVVGMTGASVLSNIDGLNRYHEARGGYEPNFLGFLLILGAIYVTLSLTSRFEDVGIAPSPEETSIETGDEKV